MNEKIHKMTYSPHELCEVMDLSYKTVLALIASGRIPAIRIGRQFRISRDAVDRLLKAGEENPSSKNL